VLGSEIAPEPFGIVVLCAFVPLAQFEGSVMKAVSASVLKLLMIVAIGIGLVACNTVRGVGKDIEAGGEAIQKATK
jgi:predicted small secreted protein